MGVACTRSANVLFFTTCCSFYVVAGLYWGIVCRVRVGIYYRDRLDLGPTLDRLRTDLGCISILFLYVSYFLYFLCVFLILSMCISNESILVLYTSSFYISKQTQLFILFDNDKNFLYCLSYVQKPVVMNAQRPSQYTKDLNNFDISGIKFPVTLNEIAKFEQQNPDFSVNVYKLDNNVDKEVKLIPLYTTPERKRKYHAHLLQTGNIRKPHYAVISNMNRLLFDQTSDRHKMYICKYCLITISKESVLEAHEC